ncbi:MAG TPA: hypothetical protein PK777_12630, partial [Thermoguttaceae bacterium]|nr:hypothetical protein [Thermoguttaceae bacterium]
MDNGCSAASAEASAVGKLPAEGDSIPTAQSSEDSLPDRPQTVSNGGVRSRGKRVGAKNGLKNSSSKTADQESTDSDSPAEQPEKKTSRRTWAVGVFPEEDPQPPSSDFPVFETPESAQNANPSASEADFQGGQKSPGGDVSARHPDGGDVEEGLSAG